jgi:transcription elongation GreA/GreB family factor
MSTPAWKNVDALEDTFMSAGDGNRDAVADIAVTLEAAEPTDMQQWPEDTRDYWESALELVLEAVDPRDVTAADEKLLFALMRCGYDTVMLRDLVAAHARRVYSDYLDPAGLLDALGVHDNDTPVQRIAAHWRILQTLKPGVHCWEPANGLGRIVDVDDIANEVNIRFARRRALPLKLTMENVLLVKPDSPLAAQMETPGGLSAAGLDGNLLGAVRGSIVSAAAVSLETLAKMLVPDVIPEAAWAEATAEHIDDSPEDEGPAGSQRAWDESRSVPELADLLADHDPIHGPPEQLANVAAVMQAGAQRRDQAEQFADVVARLWKLAPDQQWLRSLLNDLATEAIDWTEPELFTTISDGLPGRSILDWFRASAAANSPEYLADACMQLPLRLWTYAEKTLAEHAESETLLFDTVTRAVSGGDVSADLLLWLWRGGEERHIELLDPTLVFRTLQKPVRGSYLKARKDLHKLLMEDASFQRTLMKQGDPNGIASFVRCVKYMPLLDSGERQSLLVKIVRVFPEARPLVEEKRQHAPRKAIGRITSIRSFKLRRAELEDIVKRRIPANSRAIAHARSYGDLRENAEFKAAKEEQAYLAARRSELEDDLHEIKPTDFHDVTLASTVVPGCSIELQYPSGNTELFHLLGLWDSVPEQNIISYDTPLGKLLLGRKIDDTVELPSGAQATIVKLHPLSDDLRTYVLGADVE